MKVPLRILAFALAAAVAIAYIFWNFTPTAWTWMQTLGGCMIIAGFSLWLLAHIQLGGSFAVSAQARTLVTHGLYSRIRSPIYLFGSIGIPGAILLAGPPVLRLVFVVLIPLQVARARSEARVLEENSANSTAITGAEHGLSVG